ncbi:urease accessory protein UreF [Phycisphaera mikurensis]|uniref:Urease accessory protein UreF n=1 Tax=Phycisphaera mikurensis (strain NBRC 102666 / KCTC 22515 / FYK2301M01) TaxID=1142394 RepID=I0IDN9_PHYMF|nr:urease accessory UreF family protein [Phycisphaera mikurensis]MBB6441194.1 urease accessory protein [Phycisphaera mikurensis]BAM03377.1 urease accessory protein UreF [Phycisphaera mikurensis NBRC 102666]
MGAPSSAPWTLWQVIDSAFPAGGFAHSGGLEAAAQAGRVADAAGVERFARRRFRDLAAGPLVFVRAAGRAADDPPRLRDLDARCGAATAEAVAHRASLRLGGGLLAAARGLALPGVAEAEAALAGGGHLPVAFGLVTSAAGVGASEAARAFLFADARTVFSAAVRLGIAGPLDAQARLARLAAEAESLADGSLARSLEEVCTTSPLLTLLSGEQPRLYSKLFQS